MLFNQVISSVSNRRAWYIYMLILVHICHSTDSGNDFFSTVIQATVLLSFAIMCYWEAESNGFFNLPMVALQVILTCSSHNKFNAIVQNKTIRSLCVYIRDLHLINQIKNSSVVYLTNLSNKYEIQNAIALSAKTDLNKNKGEQKKGNEKCWNIIIHIIPNYIKGMVKKLIWPYGQFLALD